MSQSVICTWASCDEWPMGYFSRYKEQCPCMLHGSVLSYFRHIIGNGFTNEYWIASQRPKIIEDVSYISCFIFWGFIHCFICFLFVTEKHIHPLVILSFLFMGCKGFFFLFLISFSFFLSYSIKKKKKHLLGVVPITFPSRAVQVERNLHHM